MKRSRNGIYAGSQFTIDEVEVADIITCFQYYWRLFLQWGAKRRRSVIQRDESSATRNFKLLPRRNESPLAISAGENDHKLEHGLPPTSCPKSKNVKVKNRHRKRAPKKKTHGELTKTAVELSLENARLLKEIEQMRKKKQDLKDCNVYMNSQLALCLEKRQEQNMSYISQLSSSDSDTRQKTETTASCDHFQRLDEHEHFEKCSGSSILGSAYDKPQRLGRPMYLYSPESSFGSEKDGAIPTKGNAFSGFIDLNAPDEALFGTNSAFLELNAPDEAFFGTNSGFDDLKFERSR